MRKVDHTYPDASNRPATGEQFWSSTLACTAPNQQPKVNSNLPRFIAWCDARRQPFLLNASHASQHNPSTIVAMSRSRFTTWVVRDHNARSE